MGNKHSKLQKYGQEVRKQVEQKRIKYVIRLQKMREQLNITQKFSQQLCHANAYMLVQLLNQFKIKSVDLVVIFGLRALTIGSKFNLITQQNIQQALKLAAQCDKIRKQTNKKNWTFHSNQQYSSKYLPPLFGIPSSVKDIFDQMGKRTTIGIIKRAHQIKEKDCGAISALKKSGMIPFVRSNVSQMSMTFQTNNNLFGRSISPWDKKRNIGGSSGGEGGLITTFCTPIGLGTDIGGSLRIPAQFNGICSIKFSSKRINTSSKYWTQMPSIISGKDTILSVYGPMARSVQDLALWTKAHFNQEFHQKDQYFRLTPFNTNIYKYGLKNKIKIGYFKSLPILQITKPSQRAIQQVIHILRQHEFQIIQVKIPNINQTIQQFMLQMAAQGRFRGFQQFLQGQKQVGAYSKMRTIAQSRFLQCLVHIITKYFAPRIYRFAKYSSGVSSCEYFKHVTRVNKLRQQFMKWWQLLNLDFIIAPGFGCQSNLNNLYQNVFPANLYTSIWNVLDCVAGSLPVTTVRQGQSYYQTIHKDLVSKALKANCLGADNLPVGIQVIGRPFEQEKVLGLMKLLQQCINFEQNHKFDNEKCFIEQDNGE